MTSTWRWSKEAKEEFGTRPSVLGRRDESSNVLPLSVHLLPLLDHPRLRLPLSSSRTTSPAPEIPPLPFPRLTPLAFHRNLVSHHHHYSTHPILPITRGCPSSVVRRHFPLHHFLSTHIQTKKTPSSSESTPFTGPLSISFWLPFLLPLYSLSRPVRLAPVSLSLHTHLIYASRPRLSSSSTPYPPSLGFTPGLLFVADQSNHSTLHSTPSPLPSTTVSPHFLDDSPTPILFLSYSLSRPPASLVSFSLSSFLFRVRI